MAVCNERYIIRSHDNQEGPLLFEDFVLVNKYNFLVSAVVHDLSTDIVEVVGLADLVTPLTVNGHGLHLNSNRVTLRVMVAPDSTSPNLKKPVHM